MFLRKSTTVGLVKSRISPFIWITAYAGMTIKQLIWSRYANSHIREGVYPDVKMTFHEFITIRCLNNNNYANLTNLAKTIRENNPYTNFMSDQVGLIYERAGFLFTYPKTITTYQYCCNAGFVKGCTGHKKSCLSCNPV